jgi:hypothetical protein
VNVRRDQDRAQVFGVDRLRLAHPAGDLLRERRAYSQEAGAHLRLDDRPLRPADKVVVADHARMDGVPFAGLQADAMPAADLVDQDDAFALG